ncbi:hypothetical protein [Clostridium sp. 'White wine YQ']|uniref:hypothetical protein n=1 Tax=Clostridium sp. 'White wine YQ' TaxID=3027474 RepID=UPI002365401F|nr:hypothetical protein [Clostridium sp. 'White wine YQ']MDD7793303.1 hypothetical protein [Clostridium sp. 'White wine YQ']
MQVNQVSQLNQLQGLMNLGDSDSSVSDSSSSFQNLLEEMLLDNTYNNQAKQSNTTGTSLENTSPTQAKSSTSGINNLAIDPQKLMLMMLSMQNSNSSDDSYGDSSDDSGMSGSNDSSMQLMESLLQTALQNQQTSSSSETKDSLALNESKVL